MPSLPTLSAFVFLAFGMALIPGPNMLYLISRSICQGRIAGFVSLGGVALGFAIYMVCTIFGITAVALAVPHAYDALRLAGAVYLLYLAWQAVRPGNRTPLATRRLPPDSPRKLFTMGLVTNLLNPKVAMLYLSLLPQFINPAQGGVLQQSISLGITQIVVAVSVHATIIAGAGSFAAFLARHSGWIGIQRWLMGTVLASLAIRMALDSRR
ncbi:LysE family translocator (plasmid) [Rhizobium sp. CB3171]|uniref:LysE family translocator n=1 Tax=Rhizobium sp. CB3171 TaxID=3039157 RepID=UPI0024B14F93|nr:LysE family translocator [Rhizobium sp. CB3171]WFU06301.1 LysE family translocator [Rhizobium sp. CB3171]